MRECSAAFNQLYLHSSGKVYPCSFLQNDPSYVLGDLTVQTLDEIWNSDKTKNFQKNHLNFKENSTCSKNQKNFLCDKIYHRPFYQNEDRKMKRIDVMLDSFCNLTCIMCTNIYDETGGFKQPFFWEHNDELLKTLIEVELVGGEPLISPYFFKLVNKVLAVNPQCQWKITTNANFPLTPKLKENLLKMNLTNFSISLDSLKKDVFQQIRQGSDHDLVMNNVQKFKEDICNFCINMVVQKLNYQEVFEMYRWTKQRGLRFFPILLTDPREHSLLNIPIIDQQYIASNMIAENSIVKSKEIFLLIRTFIYSTSLKDDKSILQSYQKHLMEIDLPNG